MIRKINEKARSTLKMSLILTSALLLTATGCEELAAVSGAPDANAVQKTGLGKIYNGMTGKILNAPKDFLSR